MFAAWPGALSYASSFRTPIANFSPDPRSLLYRCPQTHLNSWRKISTGSMDESSFPRPHLPLNPAGTHACPKTSRASARLGIQDADLYGEGTRSFSRAFSDRAI